MPSISLDPRCLDAELEQLPANVAVKSAHAALTATHKRVSDFEAAVEAIGADRVLTKEAKQAKESELRGKLEILVRRDLDAGFAKITDAIETMQDGIAARLTPDRETVSPTEIRAHVKGLSDVGARASFVHARARAGDAESVAAVLNAPPYLSGLDDPRYLEGAREQAVSVLAPDIAKELDVLRKVAGRLEAAAAVVKNQFIDLKPSQVAGRIAADRIAARREAVRVATAGGE